jgi:hypothetical protein
LNKIIFQTSLILQLGKLLFRIFIRERYSPVAQIAFRMPFHLDMLAYLSAELMKNN